MATEPTATSACYASCEYYTPPVGRLPVLGKIRAEIDRLRMAIANDYNTMENRNAATVDATRKTDSETALLDQKTVSELAQTSDYIPPNSAKNISTAVQGVVEKQKNLFQKQADGFDRDAEQKLAKIMVDTWSVRQTTDGALTTGNGLNDSEINSVLNKAKSGIGV